MAVPKLRFKDSGGREFPEWEDKKLGEFFSKINKKNNDNLITNVITNSAVNGLIEQRMFFDKDIANKENTDKYYIIEKGDFVYNPRKSNDAPYGPVHMYESDCKGIVSPLYLCFKPIDKTLSLLFMKNYFKSSSWHKYIYANGDTGARDDRVSVKVTTFLDMPVNIPSLPEQQKIADFLTAYDTMIDTQTKRVEAMKTRKKGLLQKIFSQEIRFKDDHGQDFPEWKSKKLGESTYIERGGSPRPISKYITGDSNGINWIKIGDAPVEGNVITSVKEKIISEGVPKSRKVFKGDLILSNSMSYGRPYLLAVDGCIHDGWLLIRNDKNIFDIRFLMQELASQYVKAQYDRLSNQGVVSNLNKELVKSVFIKIPSLPEQRKIADFLTAVDTQIEVEEKRLETMKTIKKGLLQQMFI